MDTGPAIVEALSLLSYRLVVYAAGIDFVSRSSVEPLRRRIVICCLLGSPAVPIRIMVAVAKSKSHRDVVEDLAGCRRPST